jgi:hypothetical protein
VQKKNPLCGFISVIAMHSKTMNCSPSLHQYPCFRPLHSSP